LRFDREEDKAKWCSSGVRLKFIEHRATHYVSTVYGLPVFDTPIFGSKLSTFSEKHFKIIFKIFFSKMKTFFREIDALEHQGVIRD
jgi:hypothetical protein